jgi:hypothetical protein
LLAAFLAWFGRILASVALMDYADRYAAYPDGRPILEEAPPYTGAWLFLFDHGDSLAVGLVALGIIAAVLCFVALCRVRRSRAVREPMGQEP